MTIDASTPRSRRAILLGALGGLAASAAAFVRAPAVRAGVDGDLVLETTNTTNALTELVGSSGPALRVVGGDIGLQAWGDIALDAFGDIAVNAISDSTAAPANIGLSRGNAVGILGWSANGDQSTPTVPAKTGVFGLAEQDSNARGVVGKTGSGQGVRGEATSGDAVWGEAGAGRGVVARSSSNTAVDARTTSAVGVLGASGGVTVPSPIEPSTGVYGISTAGHGVYGASDTGVGVYAANNASAVAAIVAEGGPGTAIHGHANAGPVPASPTLTGIYGSATTGHGVRGVATTGQGVTGEATSGVGVKAVATTGAALDVTGRALFSRSGRASVAAGAKVVDVSVPGGLPGSPYVLATLQIKRGNVHVLAARPNWPTSGKVRIYLSDVASTTASTPLAWFVLG